MFVAKSEYVSRLAWLEEGLHDGVSSGGVASGNVGSAKQTNAAAV